MPGTNAGTGYPLTLRCGKCKMGRDWINDHECGTDLEATGRLRRITGAQVGRGGCGRAVFYRAEYRCLTCDHRGWSRHSHVEFLLRAAGFVVPPERGRAHLRDDRPATWTAAKESTA